MIAILILLVALTNALEPINENSAEIKTLIGKYFNNVPDIDSKYVLNDGLSKAISHYFKGKINPFPLYKIKLKIDRNPVKIPWELGDPNRNKNIPSGKGKKFRIFRKKRFLEKI